MHAVDGMHHTMAGWRMESNRREDKQHNYGGYDDK
jgi:hypothetical protein